MYSFPEKIEAVDYVLLNTDFPFHNRSHVFGTPYCHGNGSADLYFSTASFILTSKEWGVIFYQNNWLLLKRGAIGIPQLRVEAQHNLLKLKEQYDAIDEAKKQQ
jgi:hypothetical protein